MEAVLRVGPDAYLTGDAVLALHGLALVNPKQVHVAALHRHRRKLPGFIKVVQDNVLGPERTQHEGIPTTTVARALRDCRGTIMHDRLIDATHEAARAGLLRRKEASALLEELKADGN
jgi:predicted transcriptional regulator of viral defense system